MTEAQIAKLIQAMRALWPTARWNTEDVDSLIDMWSFLLADVALDEAVAALREAARRGDHYCPAPGELVEMVMAGRTRVAGDGIPDLTQAMAEVNRAFAEVGRYRDRPTFSHPAIDETVKSWGSWEKFCTAEQGGTFDAQFRDKYATEVAKARAAKVRADDPMLNRPDPGALGSGAVKSLDDVDP